MKKIILSTLFVTMVASVSAQSISSCVDLSVNLTRGTESKNVLALQGFLYAKGILKSVPNGYFGPATFTALKAYQKSRGLSQVGNTGPATRAAIKKDSCSAPGTFQTQNQVATMTKQVITPAVINQPSFPRPVIDSFDMVTLFAGGYTDWTFKMYGMNFSTSTNTVYFRNLLNRHTYTVGVFTSASGTAITLPANLTGTTFPCGMGCNEKLPAGSYEVTVTNAGGQSDTKQFEIKPFTMTVETGALQGALPATATGVKFGTFTFSSPVSVIVRSVTLNTSTSTISASAIASTVLKDEINSKAFQNDTVLPEFQSAIIGAYVNTKNVIPGTIMGSFTVQVEDYIGKKRTTLTSPAFLVTVAGTI